MSDHGLRPRRIVQPALAGHAPSPALSRQRLPATGWRSAERATAERAAPRVKADGPPPPAAAASQAIPPHRIESAAPTDTAIADSPRAHWELSDPTGAPSPTHALAPQGWEQPLVDMVVNLCGAGSAAFETWSLVIPMDARILPDTELHLGLSDQRLTLRFQTQSVSAQRVLWQHCPLLHRWLQAALPQMRDIDIDIE